MAGNRRIGCPATVTLLVAGATEAGDPSIPTEDFVAVADDGIVVLDGATSRTETGCVHGTPWYVSRLGAAAATFAGDRNTDLASALAHAIQQTADQHRHCDLAHPATPSAAVAMVRATGDAIEYLVLGDTTVVIRAANQTRVVTDDRVNAVAWAERAEADRRAIGSAEKQAALLTMKQAELALRNRVGGYWVAAADPSVVTRAITGTQHRSADGELAVLTDGAARVVTHFETLGWQGVLDVLRTAGPDELIRRVRAVEREDPTGIRWPRNKRHDDATVVYATLLRRSQ